MFKDFLGKKREPCLKISCKKSELERHIPVRPNMWVPQPPVLLTLFQSSSTKVNTSLLQTGIKLYLQLYFTSALLLIFMSCSIEVTCTESDKAIYLFFANFHYKINVNLPNYYTLPHKYINKASEWIVIAIDYFHCPLFYFCWKSVRYSPSFAFPH